jgi:RHS repeat-associated protein
MRELLNGTETPYGELWIEKASTASNIDIAYRFTGKERDEETGLYYYGARYLDSKASRWLSADPAAGDYVPGAPVDDEARKRNQSLPGMGGVFNVVNLHLYHYAGNNPVKYTDPDGRIIDRVQVEGVSDADFAKAKDMGNNIKNSDTEAGKRWRAVETSDKTVTIYVNRDGNNDATPGTDEKETWGDNIRSALLGSDAFVRFDSNNCSLNSGDSTDAEATLAHEVSGHGYRMISGNNPWTRKGRELDASAIENQYRNKITENDQRGIYDPAKGYQWALPQYRNQNFYIYGTDIRYKLKKTR